VLYSPVLAKLPRFPFGRPDFENLIMEARSLTSDGMISKNNGSIWINSNEFSGTDDLHKDIVNEELRRMSGTCDGQRQILKRARVARQIVTFIGMIGLKRACGGPIAINLSLKMEKASAPTGNTSRLACSFKLFKKSSARNLIELMIFNLTWASWTLGREDALH